MQYGTVEAFSPIKGSGRIAPDDGSESIPVPRDAVAAAGLGQLAIDQRLGFEVENAGTGPVATKLWATWSNR